MCSGSKKFQNLASICRKQTTHIILLPAQWMVKLPDLLHLIFKNSRNAQLTQDIFPENVSILVLVEGTLQLAKIFPCLANSHLFCLLFVGLFGTSTLDTLIYKDMLYLNFSILHPPMPN